MMLGCEARAESDSRPALPMFTFRVELWIDGDYRHLKRHKAYALGLDNLAGYSYGAATSKEAKQLALRYCRAAVQRRYGGKADTHCQIVMDDDSHVGQMPRPPSLSQDHLPDPDLPLVSGLIFGDRAKARGIVLVLHGCNGMVGFDQPWGRSWINFFLSRDFAVVIPNSFADDHKSLCGMNIPPSEIDPVFRLRAAQTLRTLRNLKREFPGKPIVIWGHSEGGNIAQLADYDVQGVIITGAECLRPAPSHRQRLLHIFGSDDPITPLGDASVKMTAGKIRAFCPSYSLTGERKFIVTEGDHFILASKPEVSRALDAFLQTQSR